MDVLVYRYIGVPVCFCTGVPVYWYTSVLVYQGISVPVPLCSSTSSRSNKRRGVSRQGIRAMHIQQREDQLVGVLHSDRDHQSVRRLTNSITAESNNKKNEVGTCSCCSSSSCSSSSSSSSSNLSLQRVL